MARAIVETNPQKGAVRLVAHENFFPQLEAMFPKERTELPIGGMTTGETCLGCIDCMIHHVMNQYGRPIPIEGTEISQDEIEQLFDQLPPEHLALYLHCPQLRTYSVTAGNFPCETTGLMPIANT